MCRVQAVEVGVLMVVGGMVFHYVDLMSSIKKASSEVTRIASDIVDKSATEAKVMLAGSINGIEIIWRS